MGETRAAVWVGSLDQSVDEEDLQLHFAAAGHIHSVRVMRDREQGYSRCFGFVNFERLSDAEKAANQYNGSFLKGKAIDVNLKTETRLALEKERQRHTWGGCANWVGFFDNFPHDKVKGDCLITSLSTLDITQPLYRGKRKRTTRKRTNRKRRRTKRRTRARTRTRTTTMWATLHMIMT